MNSPLNHIDIGWKICYVNLYRDTIYKPMFVLQKQLIREY